ncbi:hypothetical protein [uncultured Psychroserpens sp.]|uniref:hypothetical protein n=1 Tax=uncultured Psychroserpens sp. TaxID=255436 RepID=UPI00261E9DFE|nr:hypothetical protein [uncultured Psychroserpens sp.]
MKHLLKCTYLVLGIMLMIYGCQNDNFDDSNPEHLQDTGNDLFRKGKLSDYSEVKDFVKSLKNSKPSSDFALRSSLETSNNFIILEHQDMAIHNGDDFSTYTIPIVKFQQQEDTFSNLVVQFSVASDSTSAYILTYYPNPGYLDDYALDNRTAFSGEVTYEPLDYDGSLDGLHARMLGTSISVTYCNWGGETHLAGQECTPSYMWTETYHFYYETNDGFDSGSETIEPPLGPLGGGGGATNGVNTGASTSTIPANLIDELDIVLNLSTNEISWLSNNFQEAISIHLFLQENVDAQGDIDQEALDFAEEALEALEEDDELDFESLVTIYNGMDKECQALVLFRSLIKVNSTFTNMIKVKYLKTSANDIILRDLAIGEGNPLMTAETGARTDPNPDTNAVTDADIIYVEFNKTYLNQSTDLGYVATFYHELLHAHIYHLYHDDALLDEYPNYTTLNAALDDWFANPSDTTKKEIADQEMHNIYADFIDDLADSLVEYCNVNNISGVNLVYAKKLVWGGLNGYDIFENSLTQPEQDEAQEKLAYENFNHTQHAKSQKTCN